MEERCAVAHILASASASLPSKFQDLALRFPGLFWTKLIFPDFAGDAGTLLLVFIIIISLIRMNAA